MDSYQQMLSALHSETERMRKEGDQLKRQGRILEALAAHRTALKLCEMAASIAEHYGEVPEGIAKVRHESRMVSAFLDEIEAEYRSTHP